MNILGRRRQLPLLITATMAFLAMIVPATYVRGAQAPSWQAWGLAVDFPNQKPRVLHTTYVGTDTPTPAVLDSRTVDISSKCTIVSPSGQLTYDGAFAVFDGQSYLRCTVPSWRSKLHVLAPGLPGANQGTLTCQAGRGPMFAGADVKLTSVASANPVLDARQLGMVFSLPSDGTQAQTRLELSSATYLSPRWTVRKSAGNRMVTGMNGPTLVEVASHFNWLDFLTAPDWENYYANNITGPRTGHWVEAPVVTRRQSAVAYQLKTRSAEVFIGHSPTTGAYLNGKVRILQTDPGCFSG